MRRYLSLIALLFCMTSYASEDKPLFRGGALPHTGYLWNQAPTAKVNGFIYGIGGKLSFHVGPYLRVGTEGYVSTFDYKNNAGFYKFGWGGLLLECQLNQKKIRPVIGLSIGGGKVHDLYTLNGDYTDANADQTIYKTYSTFLLCPNFSLEYGLTDHVNLAFKVDYKLYPGNEYQDYLGKGVRFYFGFLFAR